MRRSMLALLFAVFGCGGGGGDGDGGSGTSAGSDGSSDGGGGGSSAGGTSGTGSASTTTDGTTGGCVAPQHPIAIEGDGFVDDGGDAFVVRGVNYFKIVPTPSGGLEDRFFSPVVYDPAQIGDDFEYLASLGYNTVRLFIDSCSNGANCIAIEGGAGLNPDYLDVMADVMALAKQHGLLLLLTSNDIPDHGGYGDLANSEANADIAGYRNAHYLTASGTQAAKNYWADLLGGLVERCADLDAVLAWSILNEQWMFGDQPPLSLTAGTVSTATGDYDMGDPDQKRAMVVDNVRSFIAGVAQTIREHDADGLVTMGFFAPQFPNTSTIGGDWYVDTAPLVEDSELDFFDFHAYPGSDIGIVPMAENFGIDGNKPVVMGEVGGFADLYASAEASSLAVQTWIAESCTVGYDGWMYWGYLRAPHDDATWAFTDADNYVAEALAPINQPDACTPTLEDPNLALDATATASQSLPGEPPGQAIDGNPGTQWGSGADAPQWIEIDLGQEESIGSIRLRVAQFPAGRTVHRVEAAATDRVFSEVASFDQDTAQDDVLTRMFAPLTGVRYVRVTTDVSPSWVAWRELELLQP